MKREKQHSFKVNKYITLKFEDGKTIIYIKGEQFNICKRLSLIIPIDKIDQYDEIDSIDEAVEIYEKTIMDGKIYEGLHDTSVANLDYNISPQEEFWRHCSNLQLWAENEYDTRIIHSNLALGVLLGPKLG